MAARGRLRRIGQRGLGAGVALWLAATLGFLCLRLAPGDPARPGDPTVPAAHSAALERLYGLDRTLAAQYRAWMGSLLRGDLGWSFHYRRPVSQVIAAAVPPTLVLAALALTLQYGAALTLAVAACRGRRLRRSFDLATTVLYAMPTFWLGLLALRWFGHSLGWFPTFGASSLATSTWWPWWADWLRHASLPAAALALANLGLVYRLTSTALTEALEAPYTLAARARGLSERRLLWRHALRNAAPTAVHRLGLDLPGVLSGTLILEVLFSRPGLGRVAHQAFLARDFPVLATVTTAAGALVILGSLLSDLAHSALDPRVDHG